MSHDHFITMYTNINLRSTYRGKKAQKKNLPDYSTGENIFNKALTTPQSINFNKKY